jgi:hypothetical protein
LNAFDSDILHRITNAYEERMYEIDVERMADGLPTVPGGPPSIYDESIEILNTAKKQILGY